MLRVVVPLRIQHASLAPPHPDNAGCADAWNDSRQGCHLTPTRASGPSGKNSGRHPEPVPLLDLSSIASLLQRFSPQWARTLEMGRSRDPGDILPPAVGKSSGQAAAFGSKALSSLI
ncbi:hypothetical protein MAPG_10051 [Magnaporthiopsis poae ATCC 64411]|uniref:Uncharacterized protein n=1 Tax=Magnaporthiopsis poae (strain ATCC 64411 / 73-15) TaxID=644358 RepID=A0A0C4EBK0_MAGP6|nr:hypothetical protein MAPG_10051 [Magnaporthiopsis poae ATCC 64411]